MSRQKHLKTRVKRRAKTPTSLRMPKSSQDGNETLYPAQLAQDTTQLDASIATPGSPSLKWSAKSKLKRISIWLGKVPSLAYALFYLFLIPAFAFIYYLLPPKNFYHSTINYENSISDESQSILDGLHKHMAITFNLMYKDSRAKFEGWYIDLNHIKIKDLKTSDLTCSFTVTATFMKEFYIRDMFFDSDAYMLDKKDDLIGLMSDHSSFIAEFPLEDNIFLSSTNLYIKIISIKNVLSSPKSMESPPSEYEMLRMFFGFPVPPIYFKAPMLFISEDLNKSIKNYAIASQGFPSKIKGNFIRMFG
jgi:hypothetical protein